MHKIKINGLTLYGYHGVNPQEKEKGQPFVFDITITPQPQDFRGRDKLEKTINYSQVIELVKQISGSHKFDLLESLAQQAAQSIMDNFSQAQAVKVAVSKTQPPIQEDLNSVQVVYKCRRQPKTSQVFLSLGSNQGDMLGCLRQAIEKLKAHPGVKVDTLSSIYKTQPMYEPGQPDFLNMAAGLLVDSTIGPFEFLGFIKGIEYGLGRGHKSSRYGPRPIDIDIIYWEGVRISSDFLTIPHPGYSQRNFVLVPLMEISPYFKVGQKKIAQYIKEQKFSEKVVKAEDLKLGL
ncbi:MAG: 2-amino-4-hydroxy-6-hydroxymethyldihydropteridine diphosphokinase [Actinomycetota bacterium]|nr:2-amino-4-hydroxy-6-hydroxymethyldihydropteridine diphosphokinase [Actinomycetota bacterium]